MEMLSQIGQTQLFICMQTQIAATSSMIALDIDLLSHLFKLIISHQKKGQKSKSQKEN